MTIQDLGAVGELVGAIATVATLVYIAIQVRQNTAQVADATRATRLSSIDQAIASFSRYREYLTRDDNAAIYARGLESYPSFDLADKLRFRAIIEEWFFSFQAIFVRVSEGVYDRDLWAAQVRGAAEVLREPGARAWWDERKRIFYRSFAEEIEAILDSDSD